MIKKVNINDIDLIGFDRIIRRGTGEIIEQDDDLLFVYDKVSGAHFLYCVDFDKACEVLERHKDSDYRLITCSDKAIAEYALKRFGFTEMMECYQVAFFGQKPLDDTKLETRVANENDVQMLLDNYHLLDPEDLIKTVKRKNVFLGYSGSAPVGFIGEHLEGSIGLLYVFPEYRRKGVALALEKKMIIKTIEAGFIPFGQVEKNNAPSIALQKKIGMTISDNLTYWLWK